MQDQVSINFALQLGSVNETKASREVAFIGATELPRSVRSQDRQFVENMPLNGRSFQSLIALVPGVSVGSGWSL